MTYDHRFIAPIPEFPTENPDFFPADKNEPFEFSPSQHLALTEPEYVVDLNFKKRPVNQGKPGGEGDYPGLLYTAPFRVLSEDGVKAARAIIERHKENPHALQSDERTPLCIRGLGYLSPWIQAFNRNETLNHTFSALADDPLCAHPMALNYSQINVGLIGGDRPVDAWHFDSVDYVLVIILSDLQDMVGGKLEVLVRDKASAHARLSSGEPLDAVSDSILEVAYPAAGYGIFMQGSLMAHRVSAVLEAKEPRISLVNSYVTRNIKKPDITIYKTFADYDPMHITPAEYIRHKCWRIQTLMSSQLCNEECFDSANEVANKALLNVGLKKNQLRLPAVLTSERARVAVEVFDQAIRELQLAKSLLEGKESDVIGYYKEPKK